MSTSVRDYRDSGMAFHCIHCRSEIDPKYKACPYCGEAISDFLRRYSDSPIDGKYQILARLGVGGMGEVYKVLHIHLNSIRVIKLMRAGIETDPGAHERFLREARLATRIQHPNVATLYDFSTLDDGSRYMVWEYIEGTNLHEFLEERGPLSPRYAAKLGIQALRGLDAIHRAGIIHRDVSPENLMITRDDEGAERVKIIDLGIAKHWGDEGDNRTKTGMFVGKWKYCSPEHLGMLKQGERIDGRADLYSFGIVLYETVTGVPPFQADSPHGYVMLHSHETAKAMADVNPSVPSAPELEALIFRALDKDRTKRFASAREFADALDKIVDRLPDTPGALERVTIAQATEEPTRISPSAAVPDDVETIVTPQVATTVRTDAGLETVVTTPAPTLAVRKASRTPMIAVAAALLVALIGGGWVVFNRHTPDEKTAATATPAVTTSASMVPETRARLALNAFPWATVTEIRNLETRDAVAVSAPIVTPAPVDLAPGKYEIVFSNPSFAAPVTRVVEVKAGEEQVVNVSFSDPATAPVPDFGGQP